MKSPGEGATSVRLDKWLWAARFFKTRSQAQQAIDGGKVQLEGQRVKAGRAVQPGMTLTIRKEQDEWEVLIIALADRRGSATVARTLYEETAAGRQRREQAAAARKAEASARPVFDHRPNKKERRALSRFRERSHQHRDD